MPCSAVSQLCYPSTTAALELSSQTNTCCLDLVSSSLPLEQDCCLLACPALSSFTCLSLYTASLPWDPPSAFSEHRSHSHNKHWAAS